MEIWKKFLPDQKLPCILCDGQGEIACSKEKIQIHFGSKPENFTPQELAYVMANIPKFLELPRKFGLDPLKIKVTFSFQESGREMPIYLVEQLDGEKN